MKKVILFILLFVSISTIAQVSTEQYNALVNRVAVLEKFIEQQNAVNSSLNARLTLEEQYSTPVDTTLKTDNGVLGVNVNLVRGKMPDTSYSTARTNYLYDYTTKTDIRLTVAMISYQKSTNKSLDSIKLKSDTVKGLLESTTSFLNKLIDTVTVISEIIGPVNRSIPVRNLQDRTNSIEAWRRNVKTHLNNFPE